MRVGWKGGRFNVDYETSEIYEGLRDWQRLTGDKFNYFRFYYDQSNTDPVYGEAASTKGRIFFGPTLIPALHVIHIEGDNQNTENGFYYNDELHATISFDQMNRLGINQANLTTQTQDYLKDRVEYRGKVYRVTNVQILGQIQRKPIIITIDATQLRPDELVNDIQFAQFANADSLTKTTNFSPTAIDTLSLHKEMQQVLPTLRDPNPLSGYGSDDYGVGNYGAPLTPSFGYGADGYGDHGYGGV